LSIPAVSDHGAYLRFLAWIGAFRSASALVDAKPPVLFPPPEPFPQQFDSLPLQMSDALQKAWQMFYFWYWGSATVPGQYGPHLWTIPVEFRCSMVLFLTLIATSHLRQKARFATVLVFIGCCIVTERRDIMLFLCDMLIANLDLYYRGTDTQDSLLPSLDGYQPSRWNLRNFLSPALLLLGLFFAGCPYYGGPQTPGYRTLVAIISKLPTGGGFLDSPGILLECIGGVLIVWSVTTAPQTSFITSLFASALTQYLGIISYAL